jgi:predicted GNAT superfamily acetyltransferase
MNQGSILFHEKYGFTQVGTQETDGGKKEVSLMSLVI